MPSTREEAERVAAERGLGDFAGEVVLTSRPKTGIGIILLSALLAALGIMFFIIGRDEPFVLGGGVVFLCAAVGILTAGVVLSRSSGLVPGSLFLFTGGVIDGTDGHVDAYRWDELEITESRFVFHGGYEYRAQWRVTMTIGPVEGGQRLPVPPADRQKVIGLARTGEATFL